MHTFDVQRTAILAKLREARDSDKPVLYLDEVVFTKRSLMTKTWSPRGIHFTVDQSQVFAGFRTAIVAVSPERGVVYFESEEQATCGERFNPFIVQLSKHMRWRPFYLFMDNLNVHKSQEARRLYERYRITPVYNIAACPELNCIEAVFSKVKAHFKRRRLNALANGRRFDLDEEVAASLGVVTPELVQHCLNRSYYKLVNS